MSSGDIKEMLVGQFPGTAIAQWKRTSKKVVATDRGPYALRTFKNEKTGDEAICLADEDDDDTVILDAGTMFYHAEVQDASAYGGDVEGVFVMFCPETKWKRDRCIPDSHLEFILTKCYGLAEGFLEEMSENQFMAREGLRLEDVKSHLDFIGMVECDMSLAGSLGDAPFEGEGEVHNGLLVTNRTAKRADAIASLDGLFDLDFMTEEDRIDYTTMTNEELLNEVCSSGLVHDEEIDSIVD